MLSVALLLLSTITMSHQALPLYCVIVAAGSGARLGLPLPKALVALNGVPIVRRSLDKILSACETVHNVVVTAPLGFESEFEKLLPEARVVCGGATRSASVRCGLTAIEQHHDPGAEALVLIHDAARCLVHPQDVRQVIRAADECGAATLAGKVTDTIVTSSPNQYAGEYLDRGTLWCVQTPQVFRWSLIRRAHETSPEATDDSSLVAAVHPVKIVESGHANFKITTPADLYYAEASSASCC